MSFPSLLQGKIKILEVAFEKSCQAPRLTSFKDIFLFRTPLRGGKKSVILENVSITTNSVDAPEQKRASDMYQPGHWHRGSCWSQAPAKISVAVMGGSTVRAHSPASRSFLLHLPWLPGFCALHPICNDQVSGFENFLAQAPPR